MVNKPLMSYSLRLYHYSMILKLVVKNIVPAAKSSICFSDVLPAGVEKLLFIVCSRRLVEGLSPLVKTMRTFEGVSPPLSNTC